MKSLAIGYGVGDQLAQTIEEALQISRTGLGTQCLNLLSQARKIIDSNLCIFVVIREVPEARQPTSRRSGNQLMTKINTHRDCLFWCSVLTKNRKVK